jgi:hypothetical protein
MKKIIAISVMLALVAGAVFADTAIGGGVETRFSLAKQTGGDGDDPQMGGSIGNAALRLSGQNSDGTLGGMFNIRLTDIMRNTSTIAPGKESWEPAYSVASPAWYHRVFVWWKPIPQVRVFLGIDNDGLFDTSSIVGWGFHAGDNDYIFNHHWDFWRVIFPGNWDGFGLALSFYPMPGLDLNIALPTGGIGWPQSTKARVEQSELVSGEGGMLPEKIRFQAGYSLDFGRIQFAYNGKDNIVEKSSLGPGIGPWGYNGWGKQNGQVGASFLFTALEGIDILVGGSVILCEDDPVISGGLGVVYNGDGFGVKFRGGVLMCGDMDPFITGTILPFFSVGENGQVLVDIGITKQGDSMGWSLIPAYRLNIDGGAFKIGLQIYNNIAMGGNIGISGAEFVRWNIPMLLAFNF